MLSLRAINARSSLHAPFSRARASSFFHAQPLRIPCPRQAASSEPLFATDLPIKSFCKRLLGPLFWPRYFGMAVILVSDAANPDGVLGSCAGCGFEGRANKTPSLICKFLLVIFEPIIKLLLIYHAAAGLRICREVLPMTMATTSWPTMYVHSAPTAVGKGCPGWGWFIGVFFREAEARLVPLSRCRGAALTKTYQHCPHPGTRAHPADADLPSEPETTGELFQPHHSSVLLSSWQAHNLFYTPPRVHYATLHVTLVLSNTNRNMTQPSSTYRPSRSVGPGVSREQPPQLASS